MHLLLEFHAHHNRMRVSVHKAALTMGKSIKLRPPGRVLSVRRRAGLQQLLVRWWMSGNVQPFSFPGAGHPSPSCCTCIPFPTSAHLSVPSAKRILFRCASQTQQEERPLFEWPTTCSVASTTLRELQPSFQNQKLRRSISTRAEKQYLDE